MGMTWYEFLDWLHDICKPQEAQGPERWYGYHSDDARMHLLAVPVCCPDAGDYAQETLFCAYHEIALAERTQQPRQRTIHTMGWSGGSVFLGTQ